MKSSMEKLADETATAYHTWLHGTRLKHSTPELSRFIARALLSAYNRGLEDAAKVSDDYELEDCSLRSPGSEMNAYHDGQEHAAHGISKAIRAKANGGG